MVRKFAPEFESVKQSPCWPCCEVGHEHAIALARELSNQLIREANVTKYHVHGLFGIFADGDRINYEAVGKVRPPFGRMVTENYEHAKTRFIYSRLCALSQSHKIETVCEIGFNAGLSAILLLEAAQSARVLSFDLADFPWARRADQLMRARFSRSRFPGVVFGDSHKTLDQQARQEEGGTLRCDAAFIDGAKTYTGRLQHIADLRRFARPGTRVFLDEVTSYACVSGELNDTEHLRQCRDINRGYYPSTRAYSHAVNQGHMRILECAWPSRLVDKDGVCVAELLGNRTRRDDVT